MRILVRGKAAAFASSDPLFITGEGDGKLLATKQQTTHRTAADWMLSGESTTSCIATLLADCIVVIYSPPGARDPLQFIHPRPYSNHRLPCLDRTPLRGHNRAY